MRILVVKLTSIGDIIQTYRAFNQIRQSYPEAKISWAVEERYKTCVSHLKGLDEVIFLPFKEIKKGVWSPIVKALKALRNRTFDIVFDFQGNCKSAVVLALVKGDLKVGFDRKGVAEWPNLFATNRKVFAPKELHSEERYLRIVDSVTKSKRVPFHPIKFYLSREERQEVDAFLEKIPKNLLLLCPFSAWDQKSLRLEDWKQWIRQLRKDWAFSIVIPYFHEEEKAIAERICDEFSHVHLWKILSIPQWQYLMEHMRMVIAVDSASLHLAGVTNIPTFSVFGPTLKSVYGPMGEIHGSFQGSCPYNESFAVKCKKMRKCSAPCLKEADLGVVYEAFHKHLQGILGKKAENLPSSDMAHNDLANFQFFEKKVDPFLV